MRIIIRIIFVCLAIWLANLFYVSSGLFERDRIACHANLLKHLDSCENADVLYFSESSNFTFLENETDKRSIASMISDSLSGWSVEPVCKGALHAGIFRSLIKMIPQHARTKCIVLTVNLRSFGINWIESNLETQLSREQVFYSNRWPIIKKFQLGFKLYDDQPDFKRLRSVKRAYKSGKFRLKNLPFTSVYEWDKFVFANGSPLLPPQKRMAEKDLACHFIKNYAFDLTEDNPRIKDIDAIIEYCKNRSIRICLLVLPENIEKARYFFGDELTGLIDKNVNFLIKRYGLKATMVNLVNALPDSVFIDRNWPTEHYMARGRQLIANSVADRINVIRKSRAN